MIEKMKTYHASGTVGDAYVILCKLYRIAARERILCNHYVAYEKLRPAIREVYALLPNIELSFKDIEVPVVEISGAFRFPGQEIEQVKYNLSPEYYPEFEPGNIDRFNLPENYEILQVKAGSHGERSLHAETIKMILAESKLPMILVGENGVGLPAGSSDAADLRGKSSVREIISIIKKSERFHGPLGFLSFVAVSQKVMSDVYMRSQLDISAISFRIEAVEEWRRFLVRR
jgi:hypothetical protein